MCTVFIEVHSRQWQLYGAVFWQWMESVCNLHEREKTSLLAEQKEQKTEDADSAKVGSSHKLEEQRTKYKLSRGGIAFLKSIGYFPASVAAEG
ncbi:MAG: hypothetical protein MJE68_32305 [Proteobacteria bacterium]|nr:hypothetical protein [Pseudomonadota bacterium]